MPQRNVNLAGGQVQLVTVKVPKTKAAKAKLVRARSVSVRVVSRVRSASTGAVLSRTVKTVKVSLK